MTPVRCSNVCLLSHVEAGRSGPNCIIIARPALGVSLSMSLSSCRLLGVNTLTFHVHESHNSVSAGKRCAKGQIIVKEP